MFKNSTESSLGRLYNLLDHKDKLKFIPILFFAFIVSLFEVITAVVVALFAQSLVYPDHVYAHLHRFHLLNHYNPQHIMLFTAVFCGVFYLLKNIIAAFDSIHTNKVIQLIGYKIRRNVLERCCSMSYESYTHYDTSRAISVLGQAVTQVTTFGFLAVVQIFSEFLVMLILVAFIVYINPVLAGVIFGFGIVLGFCIYKFVLPICRRAGDSFENSQRGSLRVSMQIFQLFKGVLLFGKLPFFLGKYEQQSKALVNSLVVRNVSWYLPRMAIETLFILVFVISVGYLCLSGQSSSHIMVVMGGYLYMAFRLMPGINRMIVQFNNFKGVSGAIDIVYDELVGENITSVDYQDIPEFEFSHSIEFQSVYFQYVSKDKLTLEDVSLTIQKGETVGIIGATGSGKSTLIDLLLGLLTPKSGRILIDDQFPVDSIQWHQQIGYVPQGVQMIDDSIAANIAFGEEESGRDYEQVSQVIEQAQLSALIAKLPDGIHTRVGERGMQLSGGERQRLAIARALYRNPEVLIFDEATSALDNQTEEALMQTIYALSQDHTVIMVAHRLSTLKQCNRIFEFKSGKLDKVIQYHELVS